MEITLKTQRGWDRIGATWKPEWSTGVEPLYHGIVRRWGLRVGPVGFYRLFLRTDWPVPIVEAPDIRASRIADEVIRRVKKEQALGTPSFYNITREVLIEEFVSDQGQDR